MAAATTANCSCTTSSTSHCAKIQPLDTVVVELVVVAVVMIQFC
jgi:hypothetical protein